MLLAVLANCGGGSGAKDVTAIGGYWYGLGGIEHITCAGGATSPEGATVSVAGSVQILIWSVPSSPSDGYDVISTGAGVCGTVVADVSGKTASGIGTQTCTYAGTDLATNATYTGMFSMPSYSFSVAADGVKGSETASGTIVYTFDTSGATVMCMFNESAMYQKQ
jgi:hypothetical protein